MEEHYVELSSGWKEMSKSWPVSLLGCLPWDDYLGGVCHLGAILHGEASLEARAGQFLQTGEEKALCLVREITSRLYPFLGLGDHLGKEEEDQLVKEMVYRK